MSRKLNKIFKKADKLEIDDRTKLVIMSDCHRGAGDKGDNFIKNKNIFEGALLYYYNRGFTYIELGDGDEMWEVKNYKDIINEHIDTFKQLRKFHESGRFIMIYGNHDIDKKSHRVLKNNFYHYFNKVTRENEDLLKDLKVYESLVLDYQNYEIFLVHGHQADFFNSTLWRFSRFLVRYIWRNLEFIGLKDSTSAGKNYRVTNKVEKKLQEWSIQNNKILIAGHTHRPVFPKIGQSLYFNDGSCIHPNGITCLEIEKGNIILVRWKLETSDDGLLRVRRVELDSKEPIARFFNNQ